MWGWLVGSQDMVLHIPTMLCPSLSITLLRALTPRHRQVFGQV